MKYNISSQVGVSYFSVVIDPLFTVSLMLLRYLKPAAEECFASRKNAARVSGYATAFCPGDGSATRAWRGLPPPGCLPEASAVAALGTCQPDLACGLWEQSS